MPIYKYFGSPAIYHGKSLFHILCNLKHFGVGRIITRAAYDKDPLPSFYKILFAQPLMDEKTVEGRVIAEKVLRGVKYTEPVDLSNIAPIPDFKLVPRAREAEFCRWSEVREFTPEKDYVVKEKNFTPPPLLKILLEREMRKRGEEPAEDAFLLPAHKTYPKLDVSVSGNKKVMMMIMMLM